jgi:hypothetical protein
LTNLYPVAGVAVNVITVPELYVPPPDIVPPPDGLELVDMVHGIKAKFATKLLFPVTVKTYGLLTGTLFPFSVQLTKLYPVAGVAVNVITVP